MIGLDGLVEGPGPLGSLMCAVKVWEVNSLNGNRVVCVVSGILDECHGTFLVSDVPLILMPAALGWQTIYSWDRSGLRPAMGITLLGVLGPSAVRACGVVHCGRHARVSGMMLEVTYQM